MSSPGNAPKPVFIRALTKDEITSRCEICNQLAQWIAESRLTSATAAYCREHIKMFLVDPNYEIPPELRG
jgi:hypothetical protein